MSGRRGNFYGRYGYGGDGLVGIIAVLLLAVAAMPFVGGYVLITGKGTGNKLVGGALLLVGITLWVALGNQ